MGGCKAPNNVSRSVIPECLRGFEAGVRRRKECSRRLHEGVRIEKEWKKEGEE